MIRVGAIADVHFSTNSAGRLASYWSEMHNSVDIFVIAGDLTTHGDPEEVKILANELEVVQVPIIAILGNHDYDSDKEAQVRIELERKGVIVLEGESITIPMHGRTLGISGTKGFGGGFAGACASAFGEPEMKAFIHHTEQLSAKLQSELSALKTDYKLALTHYAPVKDTVVGERLEIYPFLGSYLLAEAIDSAGADLVIHGHAHHGTEKGVTARDIPVRNVALPLLRRAYAIYNLDKFKDQNLISIEEAFHATPDTNKSADLTEVA
ncbi:MAG TPA: metallophosphoesterase [Blastocatellia bacterium]|nr:metallophosphoesterase [Blastocatellia bacterium]